MSQWAIFSFAVFIGSCIIIIPGYIVLRGVGFRWSVSLCAASPCSTFAIALAGVVLSRLGISASAPFLLSVSLLLCTVSFLLCVLLRSLLHLEGFSGFDLSVKRSVVFFSVAFSLVVYAFVFVAALDGPSSFVQHSDAMSHLGYVKNMVHTGRYSCLEVTQYPEAGSAGASPYSGTGSYYPAAFHVVAALVAQLVNVSAPLAVNVVNLVFGAVSYPMGMVLLFLVVLPDRRVGIAQALLPLACVAFPFAMYTFGPLYSNAASMACFPAIAALFIHFVDSLVEKHGSIMAFVAFLLSLLSLVFLQPNTVFSLAVFLAPYCVVRAGDFYRSRVNIELDGRKRDGRTFLVRVITLLMIVAIWTLILVSPATRGVVSFNWAPIFSKLEALTTLISFELRFGIAQPFYSVLVFIGVAELLTKHRGKSWLVASLFLSMLIYFVDCTFSGPVQAFFSGFWYSDQWRTAALVGVISIPVAAFGLLGARRTIKLVTSVFCSHDFGRVRNSKIVSTVLGCFALVVAVYLPSFQHLGDQYPSAFVGINDVLTRMNDLGNDENSYTDSERRFVQKVIEEVGTDELILNMPMDGSCAAYMDLGVNVYYKGLSTSGDSINAKILRSSLCDYAIDPVANEAVRSTGAHYVLKLGLNGFQNQGERRWSLNGSYSINQWRGFLGVTDSSPGFTPVFSEGEYRLYRIDY